MERNIQKNGLVNLAVAVLIFLAGFGVTVFAGSLAGLAAAGRSLAARRAVGALLRSCRKAGVAASR